MVNNIGATPRMSPQETQHHFGPVWQPASKISAACIITAFAPKSSV